MANHSMVVKVNLTHYKSVLVASFPGFEDQLIGAKAGDDVTVKVTFPEDYFVAELAGKEAEFQNSYP